MVLTYFMEKKKLGVLLIILSIVFLGFLFYFNLNLSGKSMALGCNVNEGCAEIQDILNVTNVGFGFFGFMLSLGFYILFFSKSEEMILKRLEDHKKNRTEEEKFNIILKALDPYEKKVLKAIKEQDGITQSTLRFRTNMSKAKLCYVLQELEKRNLIKRIPKGKTFAIFLRI